MSSTTMEQTSKYWGPWRSTTRSSSGSTTKSSIPSWAASPYYGNEPSWEEQAFARDSAAAHLGGCVWPPRSYSCSFCHREFRSAQALGGHMNVHRRDRALLRQGSSPDDDGHEEEAPVEPTQGRGGGSFFYRPAASNPTTTTSATSSRIPVVNRGTAPPPPSPPPPPPPPPYLASIIKENKNKLFMSIPTSVMTMRVEAKDHCDSVEDVESAGRMKRRRLDHPSVTLPISLQTTVSMVAAEYKSQGVDHDAKAPKAIIISNPSCSSATPLLVDQQQEVDLELRLGSAPKVT